MAEEEQQVDFAALFPSTGEAVGGGQEATPDAPEDRSFLQRAGDVAADVGRGVVGGVRDGLQETGETIQWAGEGIGNAITGGHDVYYTRNDGFEWLTEEEVMSRDDVPEWQTRDLIGDGGTIDLPEVAENETMAGSMVRGTSQFLTGYAAAGRALQLGRAATATGTVVRATGQGAATDFVSFDAHEDRFSDFLRDNFGLQDPITEFLSADEDDTVLQGKLKNSLEGMGLGVATDGLVSLATAFRRAKQVQADQGDEAAAEVMNEALADMADNGQLELFDEISDPNLRGGDAGPQRVEVRGGTPATPRPPEEPSSNPNALRQNNARNVPDRPERPDVDVSGMQEEINREMALVRGGSSADPNAPRTGELFNFDKMDSDVSVKDYLNMASRAVPQDALRDTTTFNQINQQALAFVADSVDVDPDVVDGALARMAQEADGQQGMIVAGKMLVQSLSREIENLAYRIDSGGASDLDFNKMVRLQSRVIELSGNLKSVITGAAQTTSAGRIHTADVVRGGEINQADILRQLEEGLESAGGRERIRDLAREVILQRRAGNGASGVMRVTANRSPKGFWATLNEVRINGLLSGPRTHAINMISNGLQLGLLPVEKIAGGVFRLDPRAAREGFHQISGIARALGDASKASLMAARSGRNILDPEAAILEANGSDFRAIRSDSDNPVVRNLINGVGEFVRLPSRALLTGDEFFKQLNYRSHLYARLMGEVGDLVATGKVPKKDAAKWVEARMRSGIGSQGQARDAASLRHSREATFTNELRLGSAPRSIQNMTNRHPWMKLVLPFVRTPTNIVVAAGQRTPFLRRLSKNLQDDLDSGDPSRMASARGKIVTGNVMWGSAILAATQGHITGSGPVDPTARARKMETGWRPYSLVVSDGEGGKRYIEYGRLDPFAMFFGIAADFVEIGGQLGEAESKQVATAAFAALANNVASKTWMRGLTEAVDAYANPEMRGEYYLNSLATSMLPYSSLMRTARQAGDGIMRDTSGNPDAGFMELRSLVNSFRNVVPGYSEDLPARRSWVTGEPITYPAGWGADMVTPLGDAMASMNPIYSGEWKQDRVLDELANLGYSFSAPSRKVLGIEMTPQMYEGYLQLHGTIRAQGTRRTMYQELQRLFETQSYDVGRTRAPDASDPTLSPRIRSVQKVIRAYRDLAKQELLRRHPEFQQQVTDRQEQARSNQAAMMQGVADLPQ